MGNVKKAIEDYVSSEITLSQSDISSAVSSREWFLNRIANEVAKRTNEPILYSQQRFVYFGSYFKGTKVKVVDEFDILVVIDSSTGYFSRGGEVTGNGRGSASPNHKYDTKYYKSDGSGVSPADAKLVERYNGLGGFFF